MRHIIKILCEKIYTIRSFSTRAQTKPNKKTKIRGINNNTLNLL